MKRIYLIMFSAILLLITACAEQNPNEDLYGPDSFGNNGTSGINGPTMDYVALVKDKNFDNTTIDGKGVSTYDGKETGAERPAKYTYNFNMAERLGAYNEANNTYNERMPKQSRNGVWFPHEFHRHDMNNAIHVGVDGKPYTPIKGCGSCHNLYDGGTRSDFLKRSIDAGRINMNADDNPQGTGIKTINTASPSNNAGHAFCWNACHSKIAQPNQAPDTNDCGRCHRLTNMREERLNGNPWANTEK